MSEFETWIQDTYGMPAADLTAIDGQPAMDTLQTAFEAGHEAGRQQGIAQAGIAVGEMLQRRAENAPEVLTTNWELMQVLDGHTLTFAVEGGGEIRLRLYNVDELLAAQAAAVADLPPGTPRPPMTRAAAVQLCAPLDVALLARSQR